MTVSATGWIQCGKNSTRPRPRESLAMSTITAIYENGVFRPTVPVDLPEGTAVLIEPVPPPSADVSIDVRALVPPGTDEGLIRIYEILARRFDSGHHDTAERHNEHQP